MKIKQTLYKSKLTLSSLAMTSLLVMAPGYVRAQPAMRFDVSQLREDFRICRQSLEEGHSGLYRCTKKAELDSIFDQAEKSLNHPMDFYEFYRVMAPTVAAIKCGHTGVGIPREIQVETERLLWLPFDVKVLEANAYIFRDYARDGALAGKQIQSINGVTAARIISTMLAASMKDGEVQTTRQRDISGGFGFNLITLLGLRAPYQVELAGAGSNQTQKVEVAGLKPEDLRNLSKKMFPQDHPGEGFGDLKFLDDDQIAQLTCREFGVDVPAGQAFLKAAFESIHAKGSKSLILDLRGNPGGEGELGGLLLSYLLQTPFKYYDDLLINKDCGMSFSFSKYTDDKRPLTVPAGLAETRTDGKVHQIVDSLLGLQQPSQPTFAGPVYILIDGGCLSTTSEFLTEVDVRHRARFIGEESAGCYYGNNSGTVIRITLPNTHLGVFIPLMSCYMWVGGHHEHNAARGVIPEFPVKHTIADLEAGVDRGFELALAQARKGR